MSERYLIELEPEVRSYLEQCSQTEFEAAERYADALAVQGPLLEFPYSSHLGGPVRELRVGPWRITYWLAPGRRAVLLTVFRKTRQKETAEVQRAVRAQQTCEAHHPPAGGDEWFDRRFEAR